MAMFQISVNNDIFGFEPAKKAALLLSRSEEICQWFRCIS